MPSTLSTQAEPSFSLQANPSVQSLQHTLSPGLYLQIGRNLHDLLEHQTPQQIMAELSPLSAYLLCKLLGLMDASSLLLAAEPEQWLACIDLDCWRGDVPDVHDIDGWLAPFAEREQLEELAQMVGQMDEALQILLLQHRLRVYDIEQAPEPCPPWSKQWASPCGTFLLASREEHDLEVSSELLISALYQADVAQARRLLMATWNELPSQLEEEAFRARQGRLESMGLPRLEEACQMYQPARLAFKIPKTPAPLGQHQHQDQATRIDLCTWDSWENQSLPLLYQHIWLTAPLLHQLLDQSPDRDALAKSLQSQWIRLIGCSMLRHEGGMHDLQAMTFRGQHVLDLIQLGLCYLIPYANPKDHLTAEQCQQGVWLLNHVPLRDFVGVAASKLRPIQRQAQALCHAPAVQQWLAEIDHGDDRDQRATLGRVLHDLADVILPKRTLFLADNRWQEGTWQWPYQIEQVEQQLRRIASSLSQTVTLP